MSRVSRGCLPCRTRKVKCDEGRPACRRCVQRGEICTGYRDELSLVFRSENDNASRTSVRRRSSIQNFSRSGTSSQSSNNSRTPQSSLGTDDSTDLSVNELARLGLNAPYPWIKNVSQILAPAAEDQLVSQFFEKYVMYPCNDGSSPGFLECLPCLFEEVNATGRVALRYAVRAAAYASASADKDPANLRKKALQCYGLALSALSDSLAEPGKVPDDYALMTVVVLDIFETFFMHDSVSRGSHAQGMAQILRLRGHEQFYGARGWSLFRLAHHRLQNQQLAFRQASLPDSEAWLDNLNEKLPYIRIEKDNHQINKICERARALRKAIDNTTLSAKQTLDAIKELQELDPVAASWRQRPEWAYKTVRQSDLIKSVHGPPMYTEYIQLHHDVWIAYEWNYHRTARIILHEHLLECLTRVEGSYPGSEDTFFFDFVSMRQKSSTTIRELVSDVLATVPQSLGDIDHEGHLIEMSSQAAKCKGVGAYFLLWSIKIIKRSPSATPEQRSNAQAVFERIREYTGMKSALGELSSI